MKAPELELAKEIMINHKTNNKGIKKRKGKLFDICFK